MAQFLNSCQNAFDGPESVVQEWAVPGEHVGLDSWRGLSSDQQQKHIVREVQENGIERPKGYTVSYHYNARVEGHHFGKHHPMKPWRLTLTKQLILSYGLQYAMDVFESRKASKRELAAFHNQDYLDFLESVNPRLQPDTELTEKWLGSKEHTDCPIFDGMWNYFRLYTGASLDGARNLLSDQSDIAINWSGGLHHAHKGYAAGFCYINDIVLAIQQLLLVHTRVLYIDIDVHHGDGVEEAFYSTDRVLTLSFHRYGPDFFPGTGAMDETGPADTSNPGAHHSLNVPINEGITDQQWTKMFADVVGKTIQVYSPSAIVLQCGADSLGGDRLGNFNLNIQAHGFCVDFVKKHCHNRKLLIIGGGGYTPRNVARCWTHETALCVGLNRLKDEIPSHVPYRQAFSGPDNGGGRLYPVFDTDTSVQKTHENKNTDEYLQSLVENVYEQLRYMQGAPSVAMRYIPNDYLKVREEEDERLRDEDVDMDRDEVERQRKEQNLGGRGENGLLP